jgi:hypothetical protein
VRTNGRKTTGPKTLRLSDDPLAFIKTHAKSNKSKPTYTGFSIGAGKSQNVGCPEIFIIMADNMVVWLDAGPVV